MLPAAGVAILVLSAGVSACSEPATETSKEPPKATPSASASSESPSDSPEPLKALDAAPLPASLYEPLHEIRSSQSGFAVLVAAVDERGSLLLRHSKKTGSLELTEETLELRDSNGTLATFGASPKRPHQVTEATFNKDFVVWMETPETELIPDPWVMYAYNRDTREVSELTRAPRVGRFPAPAVPSFTGPVLAGGRVHWAQLGGRPRSETVAIWGCDPRRCTPREEIAGAALPAVSGESVYAIQTARFTGKRAPGSEFSIVRLDPESGEVTTIRTIPMSDTEFPDGLAANDSSFLWLVADSAGAGRAHVWDQADGSEVVVTSELDGGFGYPVLGEDFAAWGEASGLNDVGNFVLDRSSNTLYSMGVMGYYGVEGTGPVLAWMDHLSDDRSAMGTTVVRWKSPDEPG